MVTRHRLHQHKYDALLWVFRWRVNLATIAARRRPVTLKENTDAPLHGVKLEPRRA